MVFIKRRKQRFIGCLKAVQVVYTAKGMPPDVRTTVRSLIKKSIIILRDIPRMKTHINDTQIAFSFLAVKASQVVLVSVGEHLGGQGASLSEASSRPEKAASYKRGVKRGRPKSERKQMHAELFKRLKADPSEEIRHDFQQVKFANFKKGSLA